MTDELQHWSDDERELLTAVLNRLIPANQDKAIPAAGEAGITASLGGLAASDVETARLFAQGLKRAEALASDAGGAFASLDAVGQVAVMRQLEDAEPAFFAALIRHTYMAYYSRADIRALLGLSANPVHPDGYDVPRETPDFMAELTAPVRRRGQVYRAC